MTPSARSDRLLPLVENRHLPSCCHSSVGQRGYLLPQYGGNPAGS